MGQRAGSDTSVAGPERVALVGLVSGRAGRLDAEQSLDELAGLASAAGARVALRVLQERARPHAATFLGSGKIQELAESCAEAAIDLIVFDNELTPSQLRQISAVVERKVLDRTQLILDIFAARARTREGKLQVELAQLKYLLPRLVGSNEALSRLGGGIGTRGPGETKLEVDRRRIMGRITKLEHDLVDLQHTRKLQRKGRDRSGLATVTIVGYTNAGKSTLLNRLTQAGVLVENRLFATLDPTTRRLSLPGGEPVLLTDTVGFVRRLPHGLVQAFKSTLEVVREADFLVHVVDASSPDPEGEMAAVRKVLGEIDALAVPELLVFNKGDLDPFNAKRLAEQHEGSLVISALSGEGAHDFLQTLADRLRALAKVVELLVPYDRGDVVAAVHREGEVVSTAHEPDGIRIRARLASASAGRLSEFVVQDA